MASYDNAYSRFIALAKIVLPLAALGILSTIFLFSRGPGSGERLPYGKADVDELVREQRIGAPTYAGVTRDGTAIDVNAQVARAAPDATGGASAETVRARLDMPDGSHADIVAARAVLDAGAGHAVLEGRVEITTSTGYTVETERLTSNLNATDVISDGPVEADGPPGRIEAGSMRLTHENGPEARYVLVFKGGVKLVYDPQE